MTLCRLLLDVAGSASQSLVGLINDDGVPLNAEQAKQRFAHRLDDLGAVSLPLVVAELVELGPHANVVGRRDDPHALGGARCLLDCGLPLGRLHAAADRDDAIVGCPLGELGRPRQDCGRLRCRHDEHRSGETRLNHRRNGLDGLAETRLIRVQRGAVARHERRADGLESALLDGGSSVRVDGLQLGHRKHVGAIDIRNVGLGSLGQPSPHAELHADGEVGVEPGGKATHAGAGLPQQRQAPELGLLVPPHRTRQLAPDGDRQVGVVGRAEGDGVAVKVNGPLGLGAHSGTPSG